MNSHHMKSQLVSGFSGEACLLIEQKFSVPTLMDCFSSRHPGIDRQELTSSALTVLRQHRNLTHASALRTIAHDPKQTPPWSRLRSCWPQCWAVVELSGRGQDILGNCPRYWNFDLHRGHRILDVDLVIPETVEKGHRQDVSASASLRQLQWGGAEYAPNP